MRNRLLGGLAAMVVLALVVGGVLWWQARPDGAFDEAVSLAPADAQRLTFTDWAGVRRSTGSDVDADSSVEQVERFMADAFEDDLTSMSALPESTPTMQAELGFSPASLDWELLVQGEAGAAVLMGLPDTTDVDALRDRLEEVGYQRPDDDNGVWVGGIDLLPRIGVLTPELQYVAIDEARGVLVSSDTQGYAGTAIAAVTGEGDTLDTLDPVVERLGQPLAAAVYDSDIVCSALSMASADATDQDQAEQLLAGAGEVNPLTGFAMGITADRDVRVAMSFETEEQARANADSRATLAAGPAPGQGGDFGDRFALGPVTADGEVVTMELRPQEGEYVLSDLTSGPVLFATC